MLNLNKIFNDCMNSGISCLNAFQLKALTMHKPFRVYSPEKLTIVCFQMNETLLHCVTLWGKPQSDNVLSTCQKHPLVKQYGIEHDGQVLFKTEYSVSVEKPSVLPHSS